MGLIIDSPRLARRLDAAFDSQIPQIAYEVVADDGSACLAWVERTAGGAVRHATEPNTTAATRSWVRFLETLPIDWLL